VSWRALPVAAVLFDLDGTLLDTAGDIALALNRALADEGLGGLPVATVRTLVGRGSPVLVERALERVGPGADAATRARLLERFFGHYQDVHDSGESNSVAYPGALEGVVALAARGLPLAVVTNKQQGLARQALADAGLLEAFRVVVGGDSCARRKPDPEPLLFACARLGVAPAAALMVGDSVNDVRAARAAGIRVLCVPYGYNEGEDPRRLPCDGFLETLAELAPLLATNGAAHLPTPPPSA
jgi:phosphoglycolate phosphatase